MELNTLELAKHPFFEGLTEKQLQLLLEDAMQVNMKAHDLIFTQGSPANRFYLIQHGDVAIESSNERYGEDVPVQIEKLGTGDVLGWSWMFAPYVWHFNARTLTPVRAIFFYGTRLRERCDNDPVLGYTLMKRVAEIAIHRLQATRKRLMEDKNVSAAS